MVQNNILSWFFDFKQSKDALVRLGFSKEEADDQISDLLEIITLSVAMRIKQEVIGDPNADFTTILTLMQKQKDDPAIRLIITEESTKVVEGYLSEINRVKNS